MPAICNELWLTWNDIAEHAAGPPITIAAHTINHPVLPRTSEAVVRCELRDARAALEGALRREVRHLAYPYGAAGPREFRLGAFQRERYIDVVAWGEATALWTGFFATYEGGLLARKQFTISVFKGNQRVSYGLLRPYRSSLP